MDIEIPKLVLKKTQNELPVYMFEAKVQFEIENFMNFSIGELISGEIEIPEIDAVCSLKITPYDSYYINCHILLKGLNEELQTPGKYQVRIVGSAKGSVIVDSGLMKITNGTFRFGSDYIIRKFFTNALSPSGSLVFDVTVALKQIKANPSAIILQNTTKACKQMSNNIHRMLDDPQFSDFKFIVKGKEFKVYRAILAPASPVLTKMFAADMEEARNGECIVEDIEPEIFEHLLRFIYTGKLPSALSAVSLKLFEAAHYYEIKELKKICIAVLFSLLTTDNAIEMFKWANVYDENALKMKSWEIIKRDILKIFLPLENEPPTPELVKEILDHKQRDQKFWKRVYKRKLEPAKP